MTARLTPTDGLRIEIAWFANGGEEGKPALGTPETLSWADLASIIVDNRRVGAKDGCNLIPIRFEREPGKPRVVRRKAVNARARTAIALDIEENKATGELPPSVGDIVHRLQMLALAAIVWTTHSHTAVRPRYRVLVPLSSEIAPDLPAVEIMAQRLSLDAVFDRSKRGPASLFYLPSAASFDDLDDPHEAHVVSGAAYGAALMGKEAGALLAKRKAEEERVAAEAHAAAQERLEARIAAGFDPSDSLIERLRQRFDLASVLVSHGYDRQGTKFRHPNSQSGSYGADIKLLGIERVYSHNAGDPLHRDNLPEWTAAVTAIDVVDVVTILDFGGDRTRALRELAERFGITKTAERKAVAKLLFRMVRQQAAQEKIEAAAIAEGERLGLSRAEVCHVATWVARDAP